MKAESTRWKQFVTARSMQESQRVIYQGYTIGFLGKVIQKKKIPKSLHRPFSILGSSSARSIRTILTSRQRPLKLSTLHHRWPGQPSGQRLQNESEVDQQPNQLQGSRNKSEADQPNELKRTELRLVFIVFLAFSQGVDNPRIKALSLKVT